MGDHTRAAADMAAAVELVRADPRVDADRIALWFFSGGGPLPALWLRRPYGARTEVNDVPNGRHTLDALDRTEESREAVHRAMRWVRGLCPRAFGRRLRRTREVPVRLGTCA